jgi:H+/Cl- antiporter ClcA
MLPGIFHDRQDDKDPDAPVAGEQLTRQQAIRQIERRRRFLMRAALFTLLMILLTVIWAFSEYHNAGGWPTHGFSQSSGIKNVWNYWIIYPAFVWALLTAGDAWFVYRNKPISEAEIKREIDRQAGPRADADEKKAA